MSTDSMNPVYWGEDRLFMVLFYEDEKLQPVVENYKDVAQEPYVEEGQEESLLRVFTSAEAVRAYLESVPLKPEIVPSLKIVSMAPKAAMSIVKTIDEVYERRGRYLRVDVIRLDNDVQTREILYSRLINKN